MIDTVNISEDVDTVLYGRVYVRKGLLAPNYFVFLEDGGCIVWFSRLERYAYFMWPQVDVELAAPHDERQVLMDMRRHVRECIESKSPALFKRLKSTKPKSKG